MKRKVDDADIVFQGKAQKRTKGASSDFKDRFREGLIDNAALQEQREQYAQSQP